MIARALFVHIHGGYQRKFGESVEKPTILQNMAFAVNKDLREKWNLTVDFLRGNVYNSPVCMLASIF